MTFASKITVGRICLVPIYAFFATWYGQTVAAGQPDESLRWWALGIFIAAAASDGIDGWIARHFNQVSHLGAILDPIADKALLLTGVVTLSLVDWGKDDWGLPLWFAAVVILRDCIILGGIKILWKHRCEIKFAPHWSGKICTASQMLAIGWVMLKFVNISPLYPCMIATIFTIWSMLAYLHQGWKILHRT